MALYDLPFFPVAGSTGDTGKDGVSPTVTVSDITGGHRLTIVDAVGTKTVDIMDGDKGPAGEQGPSGKNGTNGTNATITGASATVDSTSGTPNVSVTLGGTASERTFAFSFTGLRGIKGDTGEQGPEGPRGETGLQGETGQTGPTGPSGPAGKDGTNGNDGKDGVGIKSVSINNFGELVIVYTDSDAEINLGKVVGAPGEQGIQGPIGPQGPAYVLTDEDKTEIVNAVLAKINEQV